MHDMVVDADEFAIAIDRILNNLGSGTREHVSKAVEKATRAGRKVAKKKAPEREDEHPMKGEYKRSLTYKVNVKGERFTGEVGSKRFPGLVHLLEKGHATIGGGTVPPYPHMIDGKEEADKVLAKEIGLAVDKAVRQA